LVSYFPNVVAYYAPSMHAKYSDQYGIELLLDILLEMNNQDHYNYCMYWYLVLR